MQVDPESMREQVFEKIERGEGPLRVKGWITCCADDDRLPYLVLVLDLETEQGAYPVTVSLIRSKFWYVREGEGGGYVPIPQGGPDEAVSETSGFRVEQSVQGRVVRGFPRRNSPVLRPDLDLVAAEVLFGITDGAGRSIPVRVSLQPIPVGRLTSWR
jgi:hypothetical protein